MKTFTQSGLKFLLLISLAVGSFSGCSLSSFAQNHSRSFDAVSCTAARADTTTVYVDSLGWHTGIVIAAKDAAQSLGGVIPEFRRSPWVEIGWGDRDFYMASGYSYSAGVRALFFSRGSAIHAAGFEETPERFFDQYELVQLTLNRQQLDSLLRYILEHLELDACCNAQRLGASLYGEGSFYAGRGDFSITRTCNSWTAGALVAAGCPIDAELTRASTLLRELRGVRAFPLDSHESPEPVP